MSVIFTSEVCFYNRGMLTEVFKEFVVWFTLLLQRAVSRVTLPFGNDGIQSTFPVCFFRLVMIASRILSKGRWETSLGYLDLQPEFVYNFNISQRFLFSSDAYILVSTSTKTPLLPVAINDSSYCIQALFGAFIHCYVRPQHQENIQKVKK